MERPSSARSSQTPYRRIEAALHEVGALVRWRFNLSGRDSVFKERTITLQTDDGEAVVLTEIPQALMGDDEADLADRELADVPILLTGGAREPLAHQLLREASNLRHTNPRASLVIGVAAAEVGAQSRHT